MQTNLINPSDQPYPQDPNQPFIPPPSQPVQPYGPPPPQPYGPPPTQPYMPPQPAQPPQYYTAAQPGVVVVTNSEDIRGKLCCPRVWLLILCICDLLSGGITVFMPTMIVGAFLGFGSGLVDLIALCLVCKCSSPNDSSSYNCAVTLYTVYFILDMIVGFIMIFLLDFSVFYRAIIGSITLCILCSHKGDFNSLPTVVTNVQPITPQTL